MDMAQEAVETLRNAAFPIYAVPPSQWRGDVMVRGAWGTTRHPLAVRISYDDDVTASSPQQRIMIVSTGAEGFRNRPLSDWDLSFEHSYQHEIIGFVHALAPLDERPIEGSDRFNATLVDGQLVPKTIYVPSAGPRRMLDSFCRSDGKIVERVAFDNYPEFRCARIRTAEVEILVESWGHDDDTLTSFVDSARSIDDDESLFREMEIAEHASWERIRQRKRRGENAS